MTKSKDIIELHLALENIYSWAIRVFKPLVASYINQWKHVHLQKDKATTASDIRKQLERHRAAVPMVDSLLEAHTASQFDYMHNLVNPLQFSLVLQQMVTSDHNRLLAEVDSVIKKRMLELSHISSFSQQHSRQAAESRQRSYTYDMDGIVGSESPTKASDVPSAYDPANSDDEGTQTTRASQTACHDPTLRHSTRLNGYVCLSQDTTDTSVAQGGNEFDNTPQTNLSRLEALNLSVDQCASDIPSVDSTTSINWHENESTDTSVATTPTPTPTASSRVTQHAPSKVPPGLSPIAISVTPDATEQRGRQFSNSSGKMDSPATSYRSRKPRSSSPLTRIPPLSVPPSGHSRSVSAQAVAHISRQSQNEQQVSSANISTSAEGLAVGSAHWLSSTPLLARTKTQQSSEASRTITPNPSSGFGSRARSRTSPRNVTSSSGTSQTGMLFRPSPSFQQGGLFGRSPGPKINFSNASHSDFTFSSTSGSKEESAKLGSNTSAVGPSNISGDHSSKAPF